MDQYAIDSAFEKRIDQVGSILDKLEVLGGKQILSDPILSQYIDIIRLIEDKLLIQWKIKKEQGLSALFQWQQEWVHYTLREENGIVASWNRFCFALWKKVGSYPYQLEKNVWKSYLLMILADRKFHEFYQGFEKSTKYSNVLEKVIELVQLLYQVDPYDIVIHFFNLIEIGAKKRPEIHQLGLFQEDVSLVSGEHELSQLFHETIEKNDWTQLNQKLPLFWKKSSGGDFSIFPAFKLCKNPKNHFFLEGVELNNSITFQDLVGIDDNRNRLIQNMNRFLSTGIAQHALLWGWRGTGKSSSIIALLNEFAQQGVRLIEVEQQDLMFLPQVCKLVERSPEKFILFCDDLSFTNEDSTYKHLKTLLDGSIIRPSANVLICATSNRKDLVLHEYIDSRQAEKKEILDEMRAIDDRFSLKLYYDAPQFRKLDELLFHCADQAGMSYDRDEFKTEFHAFCLKNNYDSPAGRSVKQFLQGKKITLN
ncbi:MAG: putative AAA+ superfamily ATPase [bacterium]|jgi:predicted AAA+ superfamily ATPase